MEDLTENLLVSQHILSVSAVQRILVKLYKKKSQGLNEAAFYGFEKLNLSVLGKTEGSQ